MQVPLTSQFAPHLHHRDPLDIPGDSEQERERKWKKMVHYLCDHIDVTHAYRHSDSGFGSRLKKQKKIQRFARAQFICVLLVCS